MNVIPEQSPAALHVSHIVRLAADAAGCRFAVFYLRGPARLRPVARFGLAAAPGDVSVGHPLLAGMADGKTRVVLDAGDTPFFGPGNRPVRFLAAVDVAFAGNPACGLLVVAGAAARPEFDAARQYALRVQAAQISALLELQALREGGQSALTAQAEAAALAAENAGLEAALQERRRIEARLRYVAFHDDLTMLHNRPFFMERLTAAFETSTRDPRFRFAVLFIDLDRFKLVNDSFGHRSGDLLLIEVAERLRSCTRPRDVVARIGGDEFALLVEGVEDLPFIGALAARIVEVVRQPARLGGQEVVSSCSVGAVQATRHYRLPEELLRDADTAMYRAKRSASGYVIFDETMHGDAIRRLALRGELQKALARGEFFIEYQPVCSTAGGRVRGVEALLRWQHPQRGRLLPDAFIAAAEQTEVIRQIGGWMLREACGQVQAWRVQYPALNLRLGLNVSAHQLEDPQFIARLRETLAASGLAPPALQLEVPERVFTAAGGLDDILAAVRDLGVRIALDHFGSAATALGYLDRRHIDTIKLDRCFAAGLPGRRDAAIFRAVSALARTLELELVAEGVEDDAQLRAVAGLGCGLVQGSLTGRPVAAETAAKLLARQGL